MMFIDNYIEGKYCFVYCGDEYCNCQYSKNALPKVNKIKFEDKYEILNMYSYLNHPHYHEFSMYLQLNNKIAVIFCKSDDELFNIIKSDYILAYKISNISDREKILKNIQKDFEAYEASYQIEYEYDNWLKIEDKCKI